MRYKFTICYFLLLFTHFGLQAQPGSLDPSFNGNGLIEFEHQGNSTRFYRVSLQPDQKIVTFGTVYSGAYKAAAFRFNPDGSPDTNFGINGAYTSTSMFPMYTGNDGAILPDGKMILLCEAVNNPIIITLIRLTPEGKQDPTFGVNGVSKFNSPLYGVIPQKLMVQPDGKILVFGTSESNSNTYIGFVIRFLANGNVDTDFGTNGTGAITFTAPNPNLDLELTAGAIQPDGKIMLGGYTGTNETNALWYLTRLLPDGTLDTSFDGDGILTPNIGNLFFESVGEIIVLPDGKIIAAGYGQKLPGFHFTTLRLLSNGSLDVNYGLGGKAQLSFDCCYSSIFNIIPQADGKLVACGYSSMNNNHYRFSLGRFKANGNIDTEFGNQGKVIIEINHDSTSAQAYSLALQADGKILVAGFTFDPNDAWENTGLLARLLVGDPSSSSFNPISSNFGLSISPNPVTDATIQVKYALQSAATVSFTLLDKTGKQLKRLLNRVEKSPGDQEALLQIPEDLPAGSYYLFLESSLGYQLIPMIKI